MNPTQLKLFCDIIRALYDVDNLDQSDIDEMLFAYLTKNKLVPENWMEVGEDFCDDLNSMGISNPGYAEKIYRKHFEGENTDTLYDDMDVYKDVLESQTGFCQ